MLAAKAILPLITALVAVPEAHEWELKEHMTAGSRKAPSQLMFDGDDYREFLVKYRRCSMLSGVDRADEEHKRALLLASMGDKVSTIAEAVWARTKTLEALVTEIGNIYPSHVKDFSFRKDVSADRSMS